MVKTTHIMSLKERVQEVFNRFNVELTVSEETAPETTLAEAPLANGTVIYTDAESFEEGVEVYIINDEGERIPLPPGDYELEDGRVMVIGEGGALQSVADAPAEQSEDDKEELSEVNPEAPKEEEKEEQAEIEIEVELEDEEEDKPEYVTAAQVADMISEALAYWNEGKEDKEDKEDMEEQAEEPVAMSAEEPTESPEAIELAAVKAELEALKQEAAAPGLKRTAPAEVQQEAINLKNLSPQERVAALLKQFSS